MIIYCHKHINYKFMKKISDLSFDDLISLVSFFNADGALVATKLGAMEADFTQIDVENLLSQRG